jgi:hypothetical protein
MIQHESYSGRLNSRSLTGDLSFSRLDFWGLCWREWYLSYNKLLLDSGVAFWCGGLIVGDRVALSIEF